MTWDKILKKLKVECLVIVLSLLGGFDPNEIFSAFFGSGNPFGGGGGGG